MRVCGGARSMYRASAHLAPRARIHVFPDLAGTHWVKTMDEYPYVYCWPELLHRRSRDRLPQPSRII
eukprot:4113658-Alexandrium_andersonii.AAC.1